MPTIQERIEAARLRTMGAMPYSATQHRLWIEAEQETVHPRADDGKWTSPSAPHRSHAVAPSLKDVWKMTRGQYLQEVEDDPDHDRAEATKTYWREVEEAARAGKSIPEMVRNQYESARKQPLPKPGPVESEEHELIEHAPEPSSANRVDPAKVAEFMAAKEKKADLLPPGPAAKPTHEMTRAEFHKSELAKDKGYDISAANRRYWSEIREAAAAGKPIPDDTRKQYQVVFGDALPVAEKPSPVEQLKALGEETMREELRKPAAQPESKPLEAEAKPEAKPEVSAGPELKLTLAQAEAKRKELKSKIMQMAFLDAPGGAVAQMQQAPRREMERIDAHIAKLKAVADKPTPAKFGDGSGTGFKSWLNRFVDEKGIDRDEMIELEGRGGTHMMPVGVVLEHMLIAPKHEQDTIKDMIVKIDFKNGDVGHYLKHLAGAIAGKSDGGDDDGPREGERNPDGLVFHDGRWHREDELPGHAEIKPSAPESRWDSLAKAKAAKLSSLKSVDAEIKQNNVAKDFAYDMQNEKRILETDAYENALSERRSELAKNDPPAAKSVQDRIDAAQARVEVGLIPKTERNHDNAIDDELLETDGPEDQPSDQRGMGESAPVRDSEMPAEPAGDAPVERGRGSLSEGESGHSDDPAAGVAGVGDVVARGGPDGPERSVGAAGGDGIGDGRGGGAGVGRGSDPVSATLNETPTPENPTDVSAGNWRYHSRDFFAGGIKTKFRNNLEALKTMRLIQEEGRNTATAAEQEVLSKFVGWGAMPGLFNEFWRDVKDTGIDYATFQKEKDKWDDERKIIKPLMSEGEWEAARKATLNSHFTHPGVVDAHWKMAQKLGFKGGRFLEPSAGIGYYLGLMPPELAGRTRSSAVELDNVTGDMLKLMYPAAHVEVTGFQNQKSPDDFYDLVASNVPFGSYKVHDTRYNKHRAQIHDYFFLKSADVVKPGGMVMHVTSTGTMDKKDDAIRQELAKTCDFVAAVRFPGGTHQANAGTEVVTDMILLRKRHPGEQPVTLEHTPPEAAAKEPGFTGTTTDSLGRLYHWIDGKRVPGPDWLGVKEVPDPAGGKPIEVNAYFADHPEQILGTLDRTGTMYRGDSVNVSQTGDYEERLQAAIDRLPEGVFATNAKPDASQPLRIEASDGVKDGGYVIHDGKLFKREGGGETEQKMSAKDVARIAGQLAIRDAKQDVVDAELAGESSEAARAKLNSVYDEYVGKYGPLSNRENSRLMRDDPDSPNLLALEKWNPTSKTAAKVDMFSRETIRKHATVGKADSVSEGVGICLNETAVVNPARIAELTGMDEAAVCRELLASGLAFEDPSNGWTPADQYLSGNVRQKLVMARAAAAADPKYNVNVEALEKNQPEDIDYQEIDVKLGAAWVPVSDMKAFVQEIGRVNGRDVDIGYVPETGDWKFHFGGGWSGGLSEFATERKPFNAIMDAVLNSKSLSVYDTDSDGARHLNEEETLAAQGKAQELREKFEEWIWSDDDRRNRLHRLYNDTINNIKGLEFNGSHLTFPGMSADFKMRALQKNFVWQVITTGTGLAAHEVGTGKTASMVAAAMELRRLGLAKKPMIAVKKANIEQITKEAMELYPGAKILSTANNFDAKNRKATIARMSTGDYDIVIMTHDQMDLLSMRPETQEKFINSELADLRAAKEAAWQDDPSKNNRVVKALEDAQAKLEAKLLKIIDPTNKDDAVHFEETGIDQIFVDEAHRYKSLPIYTHGERVKGVPTSQSNRAPNMLMRAQWLQEQNGGRGVVFATGTPVANTMAELYNIQRFLQPNALKERGVSSFDAWASVFGDRQTEMEPTVTGDYAAVTRFSKFVNIPELMQIAGQVMDVQRADDQKNPDGTPTVVRPKRQDKIVVTPDNDNTKRMMNDLVSRAQDIKAKGKPQKGEDNMAVVCSDGRKGSVDARMIFSDAADDPMSKLNQCVDNVLGLSRKRPGTTQLIFSNVGVNPSPQTGFHLYGDIIDKLVKGGIPRDKIADFSVLEGPKKDAAQEAMRRGDIIVGIGSTEKLGTGTNVQHKVMAMHHLDVPWQPAEIEQRDGRGYRCGNRNDPTKPANEQNVDIYRYVSEGSLDTFMWNLVGKKAHFINQVIGGKGKARTVADEDTATLTPEQLMAVASGDPRILRKVQLESDVRELKMAEKRSSRDESKRHDDIKHLETSAIPELEELHRHATHDAKHVESQTAGKDDFAFSIGSTVHRDRKAAGEALDEHFRKLEGQSYYERMKQGDKPIGEYKGFKIHVGTAEGYGTIEPKVLMEGPSGRKYHARASVASMDATMRGIANQAKAHAESVTKLRDGLTAMKANVGNGFKRSSEYEAAKKELAELEKELLGENHHFPASGKLSHDAVEVEEVTSSRRPSTIEERYARIESVAARVDRYSGYGSMTDDQIAKTISGAARRTEKHPTPAQIEAGNYKKGKFWLWGQEVAIENPKGSIRRGVNHRGEEWAHKMPCHYGYLRRNKSLADFDNLDCFIGPHPKSELVFVVDQQKPDGRWDEHKLLLGFNSLAEAKAAYESAYHAGWRGMRDITPLTKQQFLKWLEYGDTSSPIKRQVHQYSRVDKIEARIVRNATVGACNDHSCLQDVR